MKTTENKSVALDLIATGKAERNSVLTALLTKDSKSDSERSKICNFNKDVAILTLLEHLLNGKDLTSKEVEFIERIAKVNQGNVKVDLTGMTALQAFEKTGWSMKRILKDYTLVDNLLVSNAKVAQEEPKVLDVQLVKANKPIEVVEAKVA